jgi:signal transduction histidine kinase/CheY-like chemotaxis protein
MQLDWELFASVKNTLFLFALATQCALAWIFSVLFLAFLRVPGVQPYFRSWTWAWFARAAALSIAFLRFAVPMLEGRDSAELDGTLFSAIDYALYQGGKFLNAAWLLEGACLLAGVRWSRLRSRGLLVGALVLTLLSLAASTVVEDFLTVQAPVVVLTSSIAAVLLLRLPRERRSLGTRLAGTVLGVQALLWVAYFVALLRGDGAWPMVRNVWTIVMAHNSYFDLTVDVLIASSFVVLLLQDAHRRQLEAEAERSRLRAELERTQRLSSLGTLVSGVAHELNNPLTAILGFAEALTAPVADGERARHANIIREQALRCRRIVHGLSTFSGKESEFQESIDLGALFERVMHGFEFELARQTVSVSIRVSDVLPRFSGDRFALEQMVANLLSNAVQASPPGTSVTLSAQPITSGVELAVEDEGEGIPADLHSRIFDPFFTTRAPGEGMGLGLAVVHGIVKAHGGTIRAENRTPRGARFVVTLPARSRTRAPGDEALPQREIPRAHEPRKSPVELLVIEDEPLVREMLAALGARRGWRVATAGSGRAGLERLRAEGERFDAVLCDLRMATPSGIELHDLLAAEQPRLVERFLFFTGDVGSEEAAAFARRCTRPMLRKPFHVDDLVARIEEVAATRVAVG